MKINFLTCLTFCLRRRIGLFALGALLAVGVAADVSSITISDTSATMTNGAATTLLFPVTRTGDTSYAAALSFTTQDSSAVAGTDYTATSNTLSFATGQTSAGIPVTLTPENKVQSDKTLQLLLASAVGIGPTPSFAATNNATPGVNQAQAVAEGDFNGDGKPDLAVLDTGKSEVSIYFNTTQPGAGTASFKLAGSVSVTPQSQSIAVGDFNGDGMLDLAIPSLSGQVAILINGTTPGATSTASFTNATFEAEGEPISVAVGDFNGDGKPDLAIATFEGAGVLIYLNTTGPGTSDASFELVASPAAGSQPFFVAVGDFNGDGKPDLAVANSSSGNVSILINSTPPGTTAAKFTLVANLKVGSNPYAVAVGDFNGDGEPDLAVANYGSNSVSVLINTTTPGTATLASFAPAIGFGVGTNPSAVYVGDFNGDGKPDLAVANYTSDNVSVLTNATAPGATAASFMLVTSPSVGTQPNRIIAGDFNGDGKPDLAVANRGSGNVSILINTTPAPTAKLNYAAQQDFGTDILPLSITSADVNGDGKPDLVVANLDSNSVSVLLNITPPGATTPVYSAQQSFSVGNDPTSVTTADVNGDGKPDLVVSNENSNTVSILLNTTDPTKTTASFATQQTFATGPNPYSVTAADINGDGKPDLLVANDDGTVSVLLNTTDRTTTKASFSTQTITTEVTNIGPASITTADLNGDGKPDLVVAYLFAGSVSVLLNTTDPTKATASFASATTVSTGQGSAPSSVTTGDINGDGKPDLLVANQGGNQGTGAVLVLFNTTRPGPATQTTASFAPVASFSTGTPSSPTSVTTADVDGDGKLDLLVANQSGSNVLVFLNTTKPGASAPSFDARLTFTTGELPTSVTTADVNGDGRPDVVVANEGASTVAVLLNTQYQVTLSGSPATGTISYQSSSPDIFSFTSVTGATPGVAQTSNLVTPDETAPAPISIAGGSYAITPSGGTQGAFTTGNGTLHPGDSVTVQQTSSASFSTETTATLTIGTTTGNFNVTTRAASTTPNAFSFSPVTGVDPSTLQTSNTIAVTGIETGVPVSISAGGQYAITHGGVMGGYTANNGMVQPNDQVTVQLTSSASFSTQSQTTLTIGSGANAQSGEFDVTTRAANTTPTPFSFSPTSVSNVPLSTVESSSSIVVMGIEAPVGISISGDPSAVYCINANPCTNMMGGAVNDGDSVVVEITSSASFSTTSSASLIIGGESAGYAVTTRAEDTQANSFSFTPVSNIQPNTVIMSNSITITGIETAVPVSITGGSYSLNSGAFTTAAGTVNNNDTVVVEQTSSSSLGTSTTATLTVGSGSTTTIGNFVVTTTGVNTTPNPYGFGARDNVATGSTQTSNTVTISGTNTAAPISVSGGSYSINGGAFTSASDSIPPNAQVAVQVVASASFSTPAIVTLTIGGVQGTFTVTTVAADTSPDSYSFNAITGVMPSSVQTSNTVTITGINTASPISITGGSYRVNSGTYTTAAGSVNPNDTVTLQQNAASSFNTTATATLSIGSGSDSVKGSYSVTTEAAQTNPGAFSFGSVANVVPGSTQTSGTIIVNGINTASPISVAGGLYSLNGGTFTTTTGTVNPGDQVAVQGTASAGFSTTTQVVLTIGSVQGSYSITTEAADTTPDAFSFIGVSGVNPGTTQTSDAIIVTGINTQAPVTITGGTYSVNGGSYTDAAGVVSLNDKVSVQAQASGAFSTTIQVVLNIGGVTSNFTISTRQPNTTPTAFSFRPVSNVTPGSTQTSNTITLDGIETTVPVTISGGSYSLNGGAYTTASGTVKPGDSVTLQVTASSASNTAVDAVLTVGSGDTAKSGSFSVTTAGAAVLNLSPDPLIFVQERETRSGFTDPKMVNLTNTGASTLTIDSISVTGDFKETSTTCGATVAAGASCTLSIAMSTSLDHLKKSGALTAMSNVGTATASLTGVITGDQKSGAFGPWMLMSLLGLVGLRRWGEGWHGLLNRRVGDARIRSWSRVFMARAVTVPSAQWWRISFQMPTSPEIQMR